MVFEEIVVTAQKREQNIDDVPAAISAFSADTMTRQGISNIRDLGKFVPNLSITNFSAGSAISSNPFIRGIGIQDHLITTDPGVGVYIDGVYLGRQVGQNWSLANIERLEVLRGPQGTLYGRNSIGGAINIITRRPGEENEARISLAGGTRGHVNTDAYGSYRVSDQLALAASVAYKRRNGLGRFVNLTSNKHDVGEFDDISGRLSLLLTPNDDFSALFAFDGNDGSSGLNPYTTILLPGGNTGNAGIDNSDVAVNRFDNATGEEELADNRNSSYGFSATLDYALNENIRTRFIASRRKSTYQAGLDDDATVVKVHDYGEQGEAEQSSFELQVNGDYGPVDFVTGLYYFEEEGKNLQPRYTFAQFPPNRFRLAQQVDSYAAYANVGYTFAERLRLAAGARFNYDKKDGRVEIGDSIAATADDTSSEWSWALTATYDLTDTITLYGNIQSGYQSGQFPPRPFCLFGEQDATQPGNVAASNCFNGSLENITALNIEGGIKGIFFERLQGSLTLFHTQYSDLPYQVSTTEGAGFNTVNLIAEQDSTGVELEGKLLITDGLYLNASMGYIDQQVKGAVPGAAAPLTPELTYSISPEYSFPLPGDGGTVSVRLDYSYRDAFFGEPSSDPGRNTLVNGRGLLNFNIGYASADETWRIAAYGRNVLDKRYESARLNTGDYLIAVLANDASEFGLRFTRDF